MKVNLKDLIKTTLPQETAAQIFHWHDNSIPAAEWKTNLVEILVGKDYITVNWQSPDHQVLLRFTIFDDGELRAETLKPIGKDKLELVRSEPVSSQYILFTILKDYLL